MSNYNIDFMDSVGSPPSPSYGAADINNIRKTLLTKGVVMEKEGSCKVYAGSEGKVIISPGQAVMADGSRIEILSGGEELSLISGGVNYVYFKRDVAMNTITPKISLSEPTGDDVALAEITSDGNVTDVREKSYAKPSFTPSPSIIFRFNPGSIDVPPSTWTNIGSLDIPASHTNLVLSGMNDAVVFYDTLAPLTDQTRDGKACFVFYSIGAGGYMYIHISADRSVWAYHNRLSSYTYTATLRGIAFYGGEASDS